MSENVAAAESVEMPVVKGEGTLVLEDSAVAAQHLSASSLNDLLNCPRKWAYGHGLAPEITPPPPNDTLVLGQYVHTWIKAWYEGVPADAAGLDYLEEVQAEGADPMLALNVGPLLTRTFVEWSGSAWKPAALEQRVDLTIAGTPLVGYVDAMDQHLVRDWKTARKPWDKRKVDASWIQRTVYSMATGIRNVEFVVISYEPAPKLEIHKAKTTDAEIAKLSALVPAYGRMVQSRTLEDYPMVPRAAGNFLCDERWCDFWSVCPMGGGV